MPLSGAAANVTFYSYYYYTLVGDMGTGRWTGQARDRSNAGVGSWKWEVGVKICEVVR